MGRGHLHTEIEQTILARNHMRWNGSKNDVIILNFHLHFWQSNNHKPRWIATRTVGARVRVQEEFPRMLEELCEGLIKNNVLFGEVP